MVTISVQMDDKAGDALGWVCLALYTLLLFHSQICIVFVASAFKKLAWQPRKCSTRSWRQKWDYKPRGVTWMGVTWGESSTCRVGQTQMEKRD